MNEEKIHKQICDYLKLQYPKVLFNTDMSGLKLPIGQAVKAAKLRSGKGFPDLHIYKPNRHYHGLFLEVKRETPYKKDGKLKADERAKNQERVMGELRMQGYYADFVWTFDMAKSLIDNYMNKTLT